MTRPQIAWNWTVSFGHVVTALGALSAGIWAYSDLSRDVEDAGRSIERHGIAIEGINQRLAAGDVAAAELRTKLIQVESLMQEVRDELRQINRRWPQ